MNARVRLALISTLIIAGVLVLVGATYQGVATALERRSYPHPGKLVDVGGHQLHINCIGDGLPTVVLEAAETAMSAAWGRVQREVAKTTRVCSYDRAGLGWSEAGDKPYDPGRVPQELHTLLGAAREPGPYVLAGHSLGASFVTRFASLYPADTAALVLIDPAHENGETDSRVAEILPWLARTGLLRLRAAFSANQTDRSEPAAGAVRAFTYRPDHLTRAARELKRRNDAVMLAAGSQPPQSLPVTRVRTTEAERVNGSDQVSLSALLNESTARRVTAAIVEAVTKAQRGSR
jgi:pimeloyl-ACP methyl ester carboxylesterase